jgi:2-haloacid dehalogenase
MVLLAPSVMATYLELKCYPEVPETLSILKSRGLKRTILSNRTPRMLDAAVNSAGIE